MDLADFMALSKKEQMRILKEVVEHCDVGELVRDFNGKWHMIEKSECFCPRCMDESHV